MLSATLRVGEASEESTSTSAVDRMPFSGSAEVMNSSTRLNCVRATESVAEFPSIANPASSKSTGSASSGIGLIEMMRSPIHLSLANVNHHRSLLLLGARRDINHFTAGILGHVYASSYTRSVATEELPRRLRTALNRAGPKTLAAVIRWEGTTREQRRAVTRKAVLARWARAKGKKALPRTVASR